MIPTFQVSRVNGGDISGFGAMAVVGGHKGIEG